MPVLRLLPELEDALRQLPGVQAASIVTSPDRVPTEVHVLASTGKPAKQIVRDVQSLALARFGIEVDHRIVSVVQLGSDDLPDAAGRTASSDDAEPVEEPDPHGPPRPRIASITVRTEGASTEAGVTLVTSGDVAARFEGKSSGPAAPTHRPRIVAAATLHAVEELLGHQCEVESATVHELSGHEVAVCVLTMFVPRAGEHVLTGSAVVRGDEADAVCRAVLDALNRQLTG